MLSARLVLECLAMLLADLVLECLAMLAALISFAAVSSPCFVR